LGALQLRIIADASKSKSIAAQIYRVKRRALRMPLLAMLALPALLRLLPNVAQLRLGGAFAVVALRE
jgi:hypothetical protein